MRSRHVIAAISAAAGLAITLPLSAAAATGTFTYLYVAPARPAQIGTVTDPAKGTCISLRQAGTDSPPVFGATNNTDRLALVFDDTNCRINSVPLAPGETTRDEMLRSVLFA
jgi:hypothetical protein